MKESKKYWIDKNNNKWSKKICDKKQAKKFSKMMINCYDCIDCFMCENCVGCKKCTEVINGNGRKNETHIFHSNIMAY